MKSFFKKIIVFILVLEARAVLWKYKPKIVTVTGSVGKTSTKDAVHTVMSRFFFVRKSQKSFNSEIGVPLTILGIPNAWQNPWRWFLNIIEGIFLIVLPNHYPEWLILEIGADRPGDIKKITGWLTSDIVVVTRFSKVPVHVEFFDSPEAVIKEKSNLVKALKKDGLLITNADDEDALSFRKLTQARTFSYGFRNNSDVLVSNYSISYDAGGEKRQPEGINFKVNFEGDSFPIFVRGVLGIQHVYPTLAAIALAAGLGLNLVDATEALRNHNAPPGRMKIIPGIRDSVIIDDTYNSSPVALEEALETLGIIESPGRKIAVLGDMLELGKYSQEEHEKAGSDAASICSLLIAVGPRSRGIIEGALDTEMSEKNIIQFDDASEAGEYLDEKILPGDVILVKGSQSMRMERTVEEIMAHPEDKEKLLVRQEEEWSKR